MPQKNDTLRKADRNQNDEFYTQFEDIQREINAYLEYNPDTFRDKTVLLPCDDPEWSNFTRFFAQNFDRLGLKKLISTSYATESKNKSGTIQLSIFDFLTDYERQSPQYDENISPKRGKIFTLTRRNKRIDINDLQWKYLEGDGDFRSEEVTRLRDEADIIVTNPPFSLFRQFVAWIIEAQKNFLIIGNQNAITYKEFFPYLKYNKAWLGVSITSGDRKFNVPDNYPLEAATCGVDENGKKFIRVKGVRWFTNLDHGRRHQPLPLMTMADNLKYSKHKEIKEQSYLKYDNYDAIDVPYTDAIPSDYDGVMGVPITFLDKYCPEQFDIIDGIGRYSVLNNEETRREGKYLSMVNGEAKFFRVIIKRKV
ncbi:MAG: adenine-specific methyltransferase EcoRI family protein [Clostridia bacterium]|nr:adenine-specific methyltransferase EcoRI family protein [Clostridia bacterium]